VPDGEVLDAAIGTAEAMCELSPFGLQMTKRTLWANLEISSLQAAIEYEDRSQLLAGYTGNLDEAIAAFHEKRKPVYPE
jgi:enoyl-CoA hydratase